MALHAGISLDGKLTDDAGHSRWVTSAEGERVNIELDLIGKYLYNFQKRS